MTEFPADLDHRLREHEQTHLLWGWAQLSEGDRIAFIHDLRKLDFEQLKREHARHGARGRIPPLERIDIIPKANPGGDPEARRLGEEALARGEVAVVLVAGGRGSRLGFEHPKGMFGIGPVSGKSLFAFHAEKILARRRRHGGRIPLLIMTSDATHDETETFFEEQRYFGLPPE